MNPSRVVDDAVQLFVDRARFRVPGFTLGADDEAVVAEICRHLDGMPLGIELAAARLSVLSPAEILRGLQQRFRLLRTSDPTAAPRQRSMQALLDWGQALLTPAEQVVFRRLSAFRAAFDIDAAAAAAGFATVDADDVAEIVWSLADESLLVVDRTAGDTRYRMLETVRAYAVDRLEEAAEAPTTRRHLADYYLDRYPWATLTRPTTLSDLSIEADTVGALIDGLLDDERDDDALALARMLAVVHHARGRLQLDLDGLEKTISRARPGSTMLTRAHLGAHLAAASARPARRRRGPPARGPPTRGRARCTRPVGSPVSGSSRGRSRHAPRRPDGDGAGRRPPPERAGRRPHRSRSRRRPLDSRGGARASAARPTPSPC